jgi:hypothetical protein
VAETLMSADAARKLLHSYRAKSSSSNWCGCQNLWDQRQHDDVIGMDDLASADPGKALLNFYERCIQQTAEQTHVPEARIRLWFERALITPAGTRGTVFRGEHDTQGLPNVAVDALENLHLIRGEVRGRGRWYELTHDRFIECVDLTSEMGRANAATRPLAAVWEQWPNSRRCLEGQGGLLDEGRYSKRGTYAIRAWDQVSAFPG